MTWRRLVLIALLAGALWQGAEAVAIKAKAGLAQYLLIDSWHAAQRGKATPRPWPWADTWPVARLRFEALGIDTVVLSDATGRSLAFGPGLAGTVMPGAVGNSVIAGHRDTHFAFLENVREGDRFSIETADGTRRAFRVITVAVVDSRRTVLGDGDGYRFVTLVTCYPFRSAETGGALRYVVVSRPDTAPQMRDALSGLEVVALSRSGMLSAGHGQFQR